MKSANTGIGICLLILFLHTELPAQQITWSKTFGDTGSIAEQGVDISQTFDGNFAVLATRTFDGNNQKILLLKLDIFGNILWEKLVADSISHHSPYNFQQTNDSGFIITGVSGNAFLIKTDKDGNLKWRKVYNNTYSQTYSYSVINTSGNGFIFCGKASFNNPPSDKGYIVKTDSDGNVQWEKIYTDSTFSDYFQIIQNSNAGGYYVVGRTFNITQPLTYYTIIKEIDLTGQILFTNVFGKNSTGMNILLLDDNSLLINSSKQSPFSPRLFLTDENGTIIWDQSYILPSFSGTFAGICKDNQNNIQKVGAMNNNITYTKISPTGEQLILRPYQTSGFLSAYSNVIKNCNDGGFVIIGGAASGSQSNPHSDILVFKTDSSGNAPALVNVQNISSFVPDKYQLFQNYPNPFNSSTVIRFQIHKTSITKIIIYDILGNEVSMPLNQTLNAGVYEVRFNSENLSTGVYFYRLMSENEILDSKKMMIIK